MAKVAIFDPSLDIRGTLDFAFEDDHEVITSTSARDLLKQIIEEKVDIVFAAIHEPEDDTAKEDGRWLCKELRRLRQCQKLPIILMGHLSSHKTRAFVQGHVQREYGATAFLQKPLSPGFVASTIDGFMWVANTAQ